jgi:hypothetical protein
MTKERRGPNWPIFLKALGGILMLGSILMVLLGSWLISSSGGLILLCTLAWIGGFTLFILARRAE